MHICGLKDAVVTKVDPANTAVNLLNKLVQICRWKDVVTKIAPPNNIVNLLNKLY